ncbi:MAG: HAMP domain-containing protein [Acidobacteriota bacterium]|nr:HAMP domain-containing protein [Acidobacteriota bacterium]
MRSLFTKMFISFLLAVVVSTAASYFVWQTFERPRQQQQQQPGIGRNFELSEARKAWEAGGSRQLQDFLDKWKDAMSTVGADAVLADSNGRDVLTGRDWSREIHSSNPSRGRGGPMSLWVRVEGEHKAYSIFPTLAKDGKYYFLSIIPPREPARAAGSINVNPMTWWLLGLFAFSGFFLARHLTSPLREMQKTIERFGRGDFSARVNSRRGDELGKLAQTIDRMAERIELLVKSQRRLLQDISHELRSPLARLGVAVELARGGGDPTVALNRVEKEADRLNTLVGELIQVTRAEGDPAGLVTETLRLDDLVRVILDDVHIEADKRSIVLRPRIEEAEIEGNPELLRRAIENIVRNAIRYSPEGTQVDVALTHEQTFFRVAVRDYGEGVPEDSIASIFDPFYRVEKDRGRTSGGVGLGLAIAKRAVEIHHGAMRASNMHPGLEVRIDLPRTQNEPAAPETELAGARA